jgi:hypothetical protein
MKFRVAFFFSKAESELGLRLWKWKWRLPFENFNFKDFRGKLSEYYEVFKSEDKQSESDKQSEKNKKTKDDFSRFLIRALFYPEARNRIWKFAKKLAYRIYNLFSVKLESIEVKGSLGDPFYDSMVFGLSGGCYCPNWENENENWSAKGEVILRTGFFRWLLFLLSFVYQTTILTFILWLGLRRAKKNAQ